MPNTITYRNAEPFTRVGIGLTDSASTFNGVPVYALRIDRGTLPNVENLVLEVTGADYDVITASWDMVVGATDYEIEYSDDGVTYTPVDTTALLTYGVTSADYDVSAAVQYVRVRGVGGAAWATASIEGVLLNTFALWKGASLNDSVGSNTLSQSGTVGFVAGKVGNAFDIDAGNYPFIADSAALRLGGSFTIAGWFYRDAATDYQVFVQKSTAFPSQSDYEILILGTQIEMYLGTGGGFTHVSKAVTLNTATWYCAIATYDSGTDEMTIRIDNGTPATNTFSGSRVGTASALRLGHTDVGGPSNFDGKLNIMMLCNRVWSAGQMARFYNSGSGIDPLP